MVKALSLGKEFSRHCWALSFVDQVASESHYIALEAFKKGTHFRMPYKMAHMLCLWMGSGIQVGM